MVLAASVPVAAKPATRDRAEIPREFKWDFTPIFADWAAWEAGMKEMETKIDTFAALKGTLAQGPQAVLQAYRLRDELGQLAYRVYSYPQLQRDTDTRDSDVSGRLQRVQALLARYGTATAWFTPELLAIPEETMRGWIETTADLGIYRFPILDAYRQQKHVLDEKGERLLSYAARFNDAPRSIFQELSTSDARFPEVELSDGSKITASPAAYRAGLRMQRLQADRARIHEAHYGAFIANIHTYAAIYGAVLERGWFEAQARNYGSTLEASLSPNNIPPAVVENLVATARAGGEPLQRYLRLRKRLLGLQEYHLYDNFVPIFDVEVSYPYEKARELVLASVAPLGADYQEKMRRFVGGGRIDVYENEGKLSGAYSAGVYGVGPYLLLNYADTLDDVFTLAHEGGHAMHTVLANETQPFVLSEYTTFVAEVASTTNEQFLLEKMLAQTTDPKERFLLLQHAIEGIMSTFYRQVAFADFELRAHRRVEQGEPITSESLREIYAQILKDYYGDALTLDEQEQQTWARVPHFYRTPFYVYQYATSFAASAQLFREMTTGEAPARGAATARYLDLLRSGGNDYPVAQLQKAGVDFTTSTPVEAVVAHMSELVASLEAEAARIR